MPAPALLGDPGDGLPLTRFPLLSRERGLRANLVLHLVTLRQFGLIGPEEVGASPVGSLGQQEDVTGAFLL